MSNGTQTTEYELHCIEALRLRLSGATFAEIAVSQDCSASSAFRRVEHALEQMRPHADYDQYRARQLAELAEARGLAYRTMADEALALGARFGAVDRLVKLHEREAKLLNLDAAPTPLEEAARVLGAASDADIAAELEART